MSLVPNSHSKLRPFSLALGLLTAVACGGGGGGDGGNGSGEPPPPEPTASPIPVDPPVVNPRPPSTGRIALENGARANDGFVVGNIEDGALADDGSMAVIAANEDNDSRAILRLSQQGELTAVFDENNAPDDVDLASLSRLRMAPTGELAFQSGDGLDSDQLHLALANDVQTIAGLGGAVAPDFRILGNFRVASGGLVAFTGGGGNCEVDNSGDSVRTLCTVALFLANGTEVLRIDHEDFELERRQANDAQIAQNETGGLFFSIPGRRTSPVVVRVASGEAEPTLLNNAEVPGLDVLARVDIVDLDEDGRLLAELGVDPENPEDPVRDRVGLLDGDVFTTFAIEGETEGDRTLFSLRGIGLGGGRAFYEATLQDPVTEDQFACLRLGDATSTDEIACEGDPFPGEELDIFEISGTRINSAGDVLFVTTLGSREDGTTNIAEIRATVRRADGELVTIVSSADQAELGTITELTTVGFNDAGQALLIAERSRSSDRALILGGSR